MKDCARKAVEEARVVVPFLVLHHIGVAVSGLDEAVPVYRDVFGYKVLSGPFHDPIQRVSVCFVGSGQSSELLTELVAPAGEESPVSTALRKTIGAYHVCYEVVDVEILLAQCRARRCILLGKPVPAVAFEGRRIAWFYAPNRQLVELLEAD